MVADRQSEEGSKEETMARNMYSVCRLCRREKEKLYIKGEKCFSAKCILEKKTNSPGALGGQMASTRGGRRKKISEFGIQLREKQKAKRIYGILERQFRKIFFEASREKGITGENLIRLLERRLDNVVYRLGFASSRRTARQLVMHGLVTVNQKKVDIPSSLVKVGDMITLKKDLHVVKTAVESSKKRSRPGWLDADFEKKVGRVLALPSRDTLEIPLKEKLIVELYSK